MDNEFILQDRIQKIQQVIEKYGEENFYISFSGGKDSTVLHHLIDMAVPNNKIPRVYVNTGIELNMVRDFVFDMCLFDQRFVIIKPSVPIKQTLNNEGYPFKSKKHAKYVDIYQRLGYTQTIGVYLGTQTTKHKTKYEDKRFQCPQKLLYQFTNENNIKISDKCCLRLKEEPLTLWSKNNNKPFNINGIMKSEGGRRRTANCLAFRNDKFKFFQPLAPLTKDWEEWFIIKYNIKLCELYYPPYNFKRTGCKGCPFALNLQEELDTLEKFFPEERKQCEYIWKPVYDEYRRIKYRLKE